MGERSSEKFTVPHAYVKTKQDPKIDKVQARVASAYNVSLMDKDIIGIFNRVYTVPNDIVGDGSDSKRDESTWARRFSKRVVNLVPPSANIQLANVQNIKEMHHGTSSALEVSTDNIQSRAQQNITNHSAIVSNESQSGETSFSSPLNNMEEGV